MKKRSDLLRCSDAHGGCIASRGLEDPQIHGLNYPGITLSTGLPEMEPPWIMRATVFHLHNYLMDLYTIHSSTQGWIVLVLNEYVTNGFSFIWGGGDFWPAGPKRFATTGLERYWDRHQEVDVDIYPLLKPLLWSSHVPLPSDPFQEVKRLQWLQSIEIVCLGNLRPSCKYVLLLSDTLITI